MKFAIAFLVCVLLNSSSVTQSIRMFDFTSDYVIIIYYTRRLVLQVGTNPQKM